MAAGDADLPGRSEGKQQPKKLRYSSHFLLIIESVLSPVVCEVVKLIFVLAAARAAIVVGGIAIVAGFTVGRIYIAVATAWATARNTLATGITNRTTLSVTATFSNCITVIAGLITCVHITIAALWDDPGTILAAGVTNRTVARVTA